ncbi:hypothetical protein HPP92_028562 [Vanilla planifolia]|uniref:Uncharacterized protein n=1 Tax=Vanilla planifolia TaxID=51239 RepID=A0A835PAM2_VANPL|nr:hypothetical protein HPP92_028562 [Vanilla planifolia]
MRDHGDFGASRLAHPLIRKHVRCLGLCFKWVDRGWRHQPCGATISCLDGANNVMRHHDDFCPVLS